MLLNFSNLHAVYAIKESVYPRLTAASSTRTRCEKPGTTHSHPTALTWGYSGHRSFLFIV